MNRNKYYPPPADTSSDENYNAPNNNLIDNNKCYYTSHYPPNNKSNNDKSQALDQKHIKHGTDYQIYQHKYDEIDTLSINHAQNNQNDSYNNHNGQNVQKQIDNQLNNYNTKSNKTTAQNGVTEHKYDHDINVQSTNNTLMLQQHELQTIISSDDDSINELENLNVSKTVLQIQSLLKSYDLKANKFRLKYIKYKNLSNKQLNQINDLIQDKKYLKATIKHLEQQINHLKTTQ